MEPEVHIKTEGGLEDGFEGGLEGGLESIDIYIKQEPVEDEGFPSL